MSRIQIVSTVRPGLAQTLLDAAFWRQLVMGQPPATPMGGRVIPLAAPLRPWLATSVASAIAVALVMTPMLVVGVAASV
jgi:hypothetical protein